MISLEVANLPEIHSFWTRGKRITFYKSESLVQLKEGPHFKIIILFFKQVSFMTPWFKFASKYYKNKYFKIKCCENTYIVTKFSKTVGNFGSMDRTSEASTNLLKLYAIFCTYVSMGISIIFISLTRCCVFQSIWNHYFIK